nr:DUF3055 domain-containing protein [Ectobacillus ponti]
MYEEHEQARVRFIGFTTNDIRYDFGIIYTSMFFGKPLIICMQTGRSTLLDHTDIENAHHLKNTFRLRTEEEANDLAEILRFWLPSPPLHAEYE